jgi:serine/threonine protein phosphatase 1
MAEKRRFAIGDIHGCIRTFHHLVKEVLQVRDGDTLYLLGDYIDRGRASREVIDYIRHLGSCITVRPVMGNHEYMLLDSLENESSFGKWLANGCAPTLVSFGAKPAHAEEWESVSLIPESYVGFFRSLPFYEETEDFLFVHAGINAYGKHPLEDPMILLWTRDENVPEAFIGKQKVIHGHTPVDLEEIRRRVGNPQSAVINLDGGCVYSYPGLGYLVALDLDTMKLYPVKNRE